MRFVDHQPGRGPECLLIGQMDAPQLLKDKVRVNVAAFGVNRADTLQRQGRYPPPAGESPILGLEVAGTVIEAGSDVSAWVPGDRVFGLVAGGGYAEQVVVNPEHLMPVPDTMTFAEAAGVAEVFLTAYQSLFEIAGLDSGDKALIHAGASGVGLAALQLCRRFNISTAATASGEEKLSLCAKMGAEILVNYREQDFSHVLAETWPGGANGVVDFVGKEYLNRNLNVLAQDGCIVYLAMLGGRYADALDMALLLAKRARIQGSTLRNRSDGYKANLVRQFSQRCLEAFRCGELHANIDSILPVSEIGLAHQRIEDNDTMGKLVMVW
ncbi:NAD(P)H-quinone oxidoreductase [Alteromonas aestuariivivens]|uniref:NAD(P)H-quinone oxidoreductase n=1 Tax=Alteromonas aestuariivivens TaxID=1938339 RepID=A0A3D8MB23_9ALTE|nr:NAD(P)H-quinone oxidoreductase [Alteromonas aestuariivivens]RDV27448.1 NAD(P)H-quinone oxidoreductase [Alteromonas aestuariivivens]